MDSLKRLHRDERGAEGLEKLLIIAAIVLPLLGLLIIFRDKIKDWVVAIWEEATQREGDQHGDFFDGTLADPTTN
ncbi:MAG: hypothetical protein AMK72_11945 [Planctomycetes bacterium SM23_25]|nr:MAG: hypothetical protein AMS14_03165 [Planctomycetes bacterium DG_20]KPK44548.1 MAG: hypothetical protein AMK72_11945 [Planctomycetes bacterium SM23_25]